MKKFTESLDNIKKVDKKVLIYFDLFTLLKGLEIERPGIKKRVWDHMLDDPDSAFRPYNGRISSINLFYYGVGEEYDLKYLKENPQELEHSKKIHPEAFIEGTKENNLRKDLNLILSIYQDDIEDIEEFYVLVKW